MFRDVSNVISITVIALFVIWWIISLDVIVFYRVFLLTIWYASIIQNDVKRSGSSWSIKPLDFLFPIFQHPSVVCGWHWRLKLLRGRQPPRRNKGSASDFSCKTREWWHSTSVHGLHIHDSLVLLSIWLVFTQKDLQSHLIDRGKFLFAVNFASEFFNILSDIIWYLLHTFT